MQKALKLLPTPDKRPVNEVMAWYKDGWQLVKKQPSGWAVYMVSAMLLLLAIIIAVDLVVALIVQMIPVFARVGMLFIVITSAWVVLSIQAGLYRSMARVAKGGKVSIEDLFWGFGQLKNQQFWWFVFFVSILNLGFQWLETHFVGQIYQFDASKPTQIIINEDKIPLFLSLNTAYWLFITTLTWAILPIITEFSEQSFWQTLQRNLYGTLNNAIALVYLVALMMLTMLVLAGVVVMLASVIHPIIALTFFMLVAIWGVPLFNGWLFSAYRHIFTDW